MKSKKSNLKNLIWERNHKFFTQRNLIWQSVSLIVSNLVHHDTLLQNATDINKKCNSYFITKCDKGLFKNASSSLLQNAAVITKCLDFITKCDNHYKLRRLLQNALVQEYFALFTAISGNNLHFLLMK